MNIKPTSYSLSLEDLTLKLKVHANELLHGAAVIEYLPLRSTLKDSEDSRALKGMRKEGERMAKRWGVPFNDMTKVEA